MIRALSLSVFLATAALPAGAETATIRSGEHAEYSRIVVEPGEPTPWTLGRTDTGYELRFDRAGIDFDTDGVFSLIPRTRLAEVAQAADSALTLNVAPGHHVRAFETARGVAIDVYAGPAPEGSPYEAALPPRGTAATAEIAPEPPTAQPEPAADIVQVPPVTLPALAGQRPPSRPPVVRALASAMAAMRSGAVAPIVPGLETAAPQPAETAQPTPRPTTERPAATVEAPASETAGTDPRLPVRPLQIARPFRAPVTPEAQLELFWQGTLDRETDDSGPAAPEVAAVTPAPEPGPNPAEAPETVTLPIVPEPRIETGGVNARVAEAETELLQQLSRAASQGLVRAEVPTLRPTPADGSETAPSPEPTEVATTPEPETAQSGLAAHLNIRSKTSIDRELSALANNLPVTADGKECLPDSALAVMDWSDDRPMLIQLGEVRSGLVGEFDKPSSKGIEALVKLYLHFGFGAEARSTMEGFPTEITNADVLADMAAIFDHGKADPEGRIARMVDCDTAAALWGLLARADIGPGDTVNSTAALRAFSALPLHLRRMLGELLAQRFLQMDEPANARAVRDAILRAPGEHGISISMINARLELAKGNLRGAEPLLEDVVRANGPDSVEAVLLYVDGRLQDGLPVDPGMVANAGALAFEFKGSRQAAPLERAQVLGLASNGDFGEAFAALARWRKDGFDPLQSQVKDELFAMLAAPEASQLFLTHYFANRDLIRPDEASPDLRLALSERLLSFGFTDEARRMRGADTGQTETGRLFLARAALADFDGAEALRQLDGFDGTEARRLRADALRMLGRHDAAAEAYLAAEAPQEAGQEAWRAGQWEAVAELDEGLRRQAVSAFGLVPGQEAEPLVAPPEPGPDGMPPGPLARNRTLLEESRAARALIDQLLADAGEVAQGG